MTSYEIHPRTNKIVNASEVYKTNKKTLGGRPELQRAYYPRLFFK